MPENSKVTNVVVAGVGGQGVLTASDILATAAYEANLAAEGYRFYAQEASEFAEASAGAVAEAWGNDG